jgi:1-acyl-sn-glycerol-3-phosphate acyltransferase
MGWLRLAVLVVILRPLARLMTGLDVVGAEHLPLTGPAIIAANHTSHFDTLLLLSLFPPATLRRVRPVAAADYFLANPVISWVSRNIIGIVPVVRGGQAPGADVLGPARQALLNGDILLIFPEGTRGASGGGAAHGDMGPLKAGVALLAAAAPRAPVTPIWIQGAGRVLPKGALIPVPMTCWVMVGEPLYWTGDKVTFVGALKASLDSLSDHAPPLRWSDEATGEHQNGAE